MKKISFANKQKVAFVASGGAIKAACFHIGVGLALEKKGLQFVGGTLKQAKKSSGTNGNGSNGSKKIPIQTYVGSSAGSIIASLLASGFSLTEIIQSFLEQEGARIPKVGYTDLFHLSRPNIRKYIKAFWPKKIGIGSGGLETFVKNHLSFGGIFTTVGIEKYLREKALPTNKFEELTADLFIVATQLDHPNKSIFCKFKNLKPRPEHHAVFDNSVSISHACAASTSLPPIYQPYPIGSGKELTYYYDGEIRETLSTHVAKDVGCDLVIASYTHQPYHYHPEIGSLADYGIANVMIQAIYQVIEQKIHSSRRLFQHKKMVLDTVNQFFKDNDLPDKKRAQLCDILEEKLKFNKNVDYLFIHPLSQDYQFFLSDHFNLSENYMIKIVRSGFKAAIHQLKNYEFQS